MIDYGVCLAGFALGLFGCSVCSLIAYIVSSFASLMLDR